MSALTEEQDHLLICVIERLRGGGTDPDAPFRMASKLEAWRLASSPKAASVSQGVPGHNKASIHAVDLEQCALFVDSTPIKRAMTDAAVFLRALASPEAPSLDAAVPASGGVKPIGFMRSKDNAGGSFWCSQSKNGYYTEAVYLSPAPTSGSEAGGDLLLRELRALAVALHAKHYMFDAPNWQPLDDARGILSQIDNMSAGLAKPASEPAGGGVRQATKPFTRLLSSIEAAWKERVTDEALIYKVHPSPWLTIGDLRRLAALSAPASSSPAEARPHSYSPDYQAMGDCRVCGNQPEDCTGRTSAEAEAKEGRL